jgi:hypothetical protein
MVLHKTQLGRGEMDFTPVRGAAAISLATRLTAESFSLARLEPTGMPGDGSSGQADAGAAGAGTSVGGAS